MMEQNFLLEYDNNLALGKPITMIHHIKKSHHGNIKKI